MRGWEAIEEDIITQHLGDSYNTMLKELHNAGYADRNYDMVQKKVQRMKAEGLPRQVNLSIYHNDEVVKRSTMIAIGTMVEPIDINLKYEGESVIPKIKCSNGDTGIFFTSDTHIGHRRNDLTDTYEERKQMLDTSANNLIHVIDAHQKVKKLVIVQGGDMIQGMANYGHQATESLPITKQIQNFVELGFNSLCKIIDNAYDLNMPVELLQVSGSHGKTNLPLMWDKSIDNHDILSYWFIDQMLKLRYPELPISTDTQTIVKEYDGVTIAFEHGDAIKMYQQIPWYGMARRAEKLSFMQNRLVKCYVTGHFHTWGRMHHNGIQLLTSGTLQKESNLGWEMGLIPCTDFMFFGVNKGKVSFTYPIRSEN